MSSSLPFVNELLLMAAITVFVLGWAAWFILKSRRPAWERVLDEIAVPSIEPLPPAEPARVQADLPLEAAPAVTPVGPTGPSSDSVVLDGYARRIKELEQAEENQVEEHAELLQMYLELEALLERLSISSNSQFRRLFQETAASHRKAYALAARIAELERQMQEVPRGFLTGPEYSHGAKTQAALALVPLSQEVPLQSAVRPAPVLQIVRPQLRVTAHRPGDLEALPAIDDEPLGRASVRVNPND